MGAMRKEIAAEAAPTAAPAADSALRILIKGSRGSAMDRIVKELLAKDLLAKDMHKNEMPKNEMRADAAGEGESNVA